MKKNYLFWLRHLILKKLSHRKNFKLKVSNDSKIFIEYDSSKNESLKITKKIIKFLNKIKNNFNALKMIYADIKYANE